MVVDVGTTFIADMVNDKNMSSNPWAVSSIDHFNFYCCPECPYRSHSISPFKSHAMENHILVRMFETPYL